MTDRNILLALKALERRIMSALTDLQAQVAATLVVEASAVSTIQSLASQLAAAVAGGDSSQLETLVTQLNTSAKALSTAVTANTPPAPAATSPATATTTAATATAAKPSGS